MKNMFFVREVLENSDKTLLKPMTLKEYVLYINRKSKERISLVMNNSKVWCVALGEKEAIKCINKLMTFEYYPIPCENYKSRNVWINTTNLEKYRI